MTKTLAGWAVFPDCEPTDPELVARKCYLVLRSTRPKLLSVRSSAGTRPATSAPLGAENKRP